MNMFITINGQLGSGKSEICRILQSRFGYEIFSTGQIQRAMAAKLGLTTLELNQRAKTNYEIDYAIDNELVKYAEEHRGTNIAFDSRLAWHLVKNSFKIHLLIAPRIAADRVFTNRISIAEEYSSIDNAMNELINRKRIEDERYYEIYKIRNNDLNNYNLVIDTTSLTPDEVCQIIVNEMNMYKENPNKKISIYVSIENVYPTKIIENLDYEIIDDYVQMIQNGESIPPVRLLNCQGSLFIYQGHHRAIAYLLAGIKTFTADVVYQDWDVLPNQKTPSQYININKEAIVKWEHICGFKFTYFPEITKK